MPIKWPDTLPPLRLGSEFQLVNPQLATELQNGRTRYRRNFTAVPVDFNAKWTMTDEQAILFYNFYQYLLVDGTKWFEMPVLQPGGIRDMQVHFKGAYSAVLVGAPYPESSTGRMWDISAEMQLYLRPDYPAN